MGVPLLWALSTALRPELETVSADFHWLPQTWTLDAFAKTLGAGNVVRWLFNSFLVALLVTVVTMAISLMAAYAFSQLRFRGRAVLFGIAMLALPAAVRGAAGAAVPHHEPARPDQHAMPASCCRRWCRRS